MEPVKKILFKATQLSKGIPRVDLHIHSSFTDGESTIEDCVLSAIKKKLCTIAFTEHVRTSSDWFGAFTQEVKNIRDKYSQIAIYYGIEAKALDFQGTLDATPDMVRDSELVLGSVHRYPGIDCISELTQMRPKKAAKIEFEIALGLIKNAPINVLAHPGGVYEKYYGIFPVEFYREIVKTAKRHNVAIELNSKYCSCMTKLFEICLKEDVWVSLGSDAHTCYDIGQNLDIPEEIVDICL